jgi:hypothetical protein
LAKQNEGKYRIVESLPDNAVLVKDYAKYQNVGEPAIYNRYARALDAGKDPGFEIVIFIERNFIIPN